VSPFIVLEGIDGAGTTTQLHRLAEWLESLGHRVHRTCEPSRGPIGQLIRTFLRHETSPPPPDGLALLFAADRLDHLAREVEPARLAGSVVLSDRYLGSSLAYQGLASEPAWIRMANSRATAPDLVLYVRVSADVALARIAARDGDRRELFEQRETLSRVVAAYDALYGVTGEAELPAVVVDGHAPPDVVFEALRQAIASGGLAASATC
jgi:dTMP kinase